MANIAPIVNTRGPLYVHPRGIVKRVTFHTLAMYANLLQGRVSSLGVESGRLMHGNRLIATIDALATVDESGKTWAVSLTNRHPSEKVTCTVKMGDRLLEGRYDAVILAGDSPEAYNDIEHFDRVTPKHTQLTFAEGRTELPPHSLTIVMIPAGH